MARNKRQQAIDSMWEDASYVVFNGPTLEEQTDKQERLATMLSEIANRYSVPLDTVYDIGEMVRLAWQIGYDKGRQR